jgi:hypothetical protein
LFGIAALLRHGQYAVAHRQARDTGIDSADNADRQLARGEGQRRQELIFAGNDQAINEIHRRRFDGDEDLTDTELRVWQMANSVSGDRPKFVDDRGAHGILEQTRTLCHF